MGAYDIQKLVEYRNISKWVKASTPSVYKKTVQLEPKGLIKGTAVKEGKMPEKWSIYNYNYLERSRENTMKTTEVNLSTIFIPHHSCPLKKVNMELLEEHLKVQGAPNGALFAWGENSIDAISVF